MLLHFCPTYGRDGAPDACEEQAQVVVDFGAGAHGGARVAGGHLLLYGNGGRQSVDVVAVGLVHATQKLARIGRQTLHVAPLPLGIERVEGQRRFAAARQARDNDEFA